jgi:hypothetical protein
MRFFPFALLRGRMREWGSVSDWKGIFSLTVILKTAILFPYFLRMSWSL